MKERGKAVEIHTNFPDFNCPSSEMPCKKHPYSSPVGICQYCLKERLMKLMCSDCGDKRLSSCSCPDISSSYRNSCNKMDVGSVGRMSFLIDHEKFDHQQRNFLRRSSSSCVEVKKSDGFWVIKKLFRRGRNKGCGENVEFCDENSEICVSDITGVSRSRSLRSFGGGRNNDLDEGNDYGALSSSKISDFSSGILFHSDKRYGFSSRYESRKSGFRDTLDGENGGGLKTGGRGSCLNQTEFDRFCSFPNRSVFPIKEIDFRAMDESAFIDLKFDSLSESKQDFLISGASDHGNKNENFVNGESLASLRRNGIYGNGGSCRITMNERGLKDGSRNYKFWKWIFKYHTAAAKQEK